MPQAVNRVTDFDRHMWEIGRHSIKDNLAAPIALAGTALALSTDGFSHREPNRVDVFDDSEDDTQPHYVHHQSSSELLDQIEPFDHNALHEHEINPATGLPMMGAVDIHGNPYGSDMNEHHSVDDVAGGGSFDSFNDTSSSSDHDSLSDSSTSFDDYSCGSSWDD